MSFIGRRMPARELGSIAAINYFAYSYVDNVGTPVFRTVWGSGNKTGGRVNIAPGATARRIIIDGTTSINGLYYHVADVPSAKTAYRAGDWILFPGGQTSTPSATVNFDSMAGGTDIGSGLSVVGTFDPSDKENDAKYNTLRHTMDFTSIASGSNGLSANATGGNFVWNSIKFYNPPQAASRFIQMGCSLWGNGKSGDNLLFENCVFDGVNLTVNQVAEGSFGVTSITRSGTTATVTLTDANSLLQTGDLVEIIGASPSGYVTASALPGASITVLSSTQFTYTVPNTLTTPATGTITYNGPYSRVGDDKIRKNVEFRYCGFMYGGGGTAATHNGSVFIAGTRGLYFAACVDFHGGWQRGTTRATPNTSGGPSVFNHGLYLNDLNDGTYLLDTLHGWDSANLKLTGGTYWLQNVVTVRSPAPWISAANANYETVFPGGTTFKSTHHLQVSTDDLNTADGAYYAWGAQMLQTAAGSFYNNAVLINNDSPNAATRKGLGFQDQGFPGTYACTVDNATLINWNYQNLASPPVDGGGNVGTNTTITYTNCRWDNPTSGSNTQISTLPAGTQTKLTNAAALNVHTTLRTAFPAFYSGVAVGGTNLDTETNMFEYMVNNPIPDPTTAMGWANVVQYHFRSALA